MTPNPIEAALKIIHHVSAPGRPERLVTGHVAIHGKRGHAMSSSTLKSVDGSILKPAVELARASNVRFPNESAEYRRAREALLAEEIELRRHIERVAEQRRRLPLGRRGHKELRVRGRKRTRILRRSVRRQGYARGLQLHVRPAARAAVPDVHVAAIGVGRRGARYSAARRARDRGAVADRAAGGVQARAWLALSAAVLATSRANSAATIMR